MEKDNLYRIFDSLTDIDENVSLEEKLNINYIEKFANTFFVPISESEAAIILAFMYLYDKTDSWFRDKEKWKSYFEDPLKALSTYAHQPKV